MFKPSGQINLITEDDFTTSIDKITDTIHKERVTGILPSFDGIKLFYEYILAENAKASVIIMHGFTEYTIKYYETAWYLLNMGYNVFLFDQRGHGYSERQVLSPYVTHVNNFSDYGNDLIFFTENLVKKVSPDLDLFVFAHSMGCAVTLTALCSKPSLFKGAVLSSPMILPVMFHLPTRFVRKKAASYGKKNGWEDLFPYTHTFNPNPVFKKSHDTSAARFMYNLTCRRNDTHYQNSGASNKWMYEVTKTKQNLFDSGCLSKINCKILVLSGGKDTVVRKKYHKPLSRLCPNGSYKFYPNSKHSIYNSDLETLKDYYDTILSFMN